MNGEPESRNPPNGWCTSQPAVGRFTATCPASASSMNVLAEVRLVFAAVFLGTAIIQPGRLNPIGTWIGVYFLYTGILGLEDLGLQQWVSDVFYGGALVVAVTISTLLRRRTT